MKKYALIIYILLLCVFSGCSTYRNKSAKVNSILWEISKKDIEKKSYLLGTCHVVDYHYLDSFPEFKTMMKNVDAIATEHDGRELMNEYLRPFFEAKNNKIPSYAFMPNGGQDYKSIYASEEEYHLVDSFFNQLIKEPNAPHFKLEEIRPLHTMAIINAYYRFMGSLERTYGDNKLPVNYIQMDAGIEEQGRKQKKRHFYLETLKDRTDENENALYIDTCDLTRQSHMLYLTCKGYVEHKQKKPETDTTTQAYGSITAELYTKGQLEKLCKKRIQSKNVPSRTADEFQRKAAYGLVEKRNKNWIPVIKSNIKESSCLIAFGFGHLPGKEGVINLLRKEGYKVKPIDIYGKKKQK
ncbi:MAG: TraB/GumN family protein [Bacteroidaceae bacterium]|nr:TraB/GumN family protein [Bacteroidaceae bacterium]